MGWRKERRTSKSAAIYIPIGVLFVVLLTIAGTSGFMRVVMIEVDGATTYTADEIIYVSGISPGDNLLFVDRTAARRRIEIALPFVNSANVTRVLPNSIRIEVTETTAAAAIAYQGGYIVIDSSGRVLERAEGVPGGLIEVRGFTPGDAPEGGRLRAELGSEIQLQILLDIISTFEREGIEDNISTLDISNTANITFWYTARFRVVLGGTVNLRQNIASLPAAVERIERDEDARVTGTFRSEASGGWRWVPDR